jgi:hypothetical protein
MYALGRESVLPAALGRTGGNNIPKTASLVQSATALAAVLLGGIVVLAVQHYATLLGVPAGDPAAWMLPASYATVAAIGQAWGLALKIWRPQAYAAIGLGAHAVTGQLTPAAQDPPA